MKNYLTRETFPKSHRAKSIILTQEGKPRILTALHQGNTSTGEKRVKREGIQRTAIETRELRVVSKAQKGEENIRKKQKWD